MNFIVNIMFLMFFDLQFGMDYFVKFLLVNLVVVEQQFMQFFDVLLVVLFDLGVLLSLFEQV